MESKGTCKGSCASMHMETCALMPNNVARQGASKMVEGKGAVKRGEKGKLHSRRHLH